MEPKIHCCLMDETRMQGKTQKEKIKLLSVTLNTNLREIQMIYEKKSANCNITHKHIFVLIVVIYLKKKVWPKGQHSDSQECFLNISEGYKELHRDSGNAYLKHCFLSRSYSTLCLFFKKKMKKKCWNTRKKGKEVSNKSLWRIRRGKKRTNAVY